MEGQGASEQEPARQIPHSRKRQTRAENEALAKRRREAWTTGISGGATMQQAQQLYESFEVAPEAIGRMDKDMANTVLNLLIGLRKYRDEHLALSRKIRERLNAGEDTRKVVKTSALPAQPHHIHGYRIDTEDSGDEDLNPQEARWAKARIFNPVGQLVGEVKESTHAGLLKKGLVQSPWEGLEVKIRNLVLKHENLAKTQQDVAGKD